jgi:hypothetical protein
MSIQSLETTSYVEESAERLRPGAIRLAWAVCFMVCLAFWWFVLTVLLG